MDITNRGVVPVFYISKVFLLFHCHKSEWEAINLYRVHCSRGL